MPMTKRVKCAQCGKKFGGLQGLRVHKYRWCKGEPTMAKTFKITVDNDEQANKWAACDADQSPYESPDDHQQALTVSEAFFYSNTPFSEEFRRFVRMVGKGMVMHLAEEAAKLP